MLCGPQFHAAYPVARSLVVDFLNPDSWERGRGQSRGVRRWLPLTLLVSLARDSVGQIFIRSIFEWLLFFILQIEVFKIFYCRWNLLDCLWTDDHWSCWTNLRRYFPSPLQIATIEFLLSVKCFHFTVNMFVALFQYPQCEPYLVLSRAVQLNWFPGCFDNYSWCTDDAQYIPKIEWKPWWFRTAFRTVHFRR